MLSNSFFLIYEISLVFHQNFAAMVPEYWLTEGGQSATGGLIDHIIENHVASPRLANRAASQSIKPNPNFLTISLLYSLMLHYIGWVLLSWSLAEVSVFELLNNILKTLAEETSFPFIAALTSDMHILPDFHGNRWLKQRAAALFLPSWVNIDLKLCHRSPVADPNSKGVIFGMTLDTSEKQLALLYLATIQGIAYGTRHIVEHCNAHGHKVRFLHT